MSKNEEAIRKWIARNRPDLAWNMDAIIKDKDTFAWLAMGFEAGRQYQHFKFRDYVMKKSNKDFHNRAKTYPSNTLDEVSREIIGMLENDY